MIQTGEGALNEVHAMLQRIRELAVQYNNGTNDTAAQASISAEATSLQTTMSAIGTNTKFNGVSLLTANTITLQVGANKNETQAVTTTALTVSGAVVSDISTVDTAIASVSAQRAAFGAAQNALEHTVASLGVAAENFSASESRIRDLDVAAEMVNFTKTQIMQQAGTAILAQANQAPNSILSLLR